MRGEATYKTRGKTIEPVFGQTKHSFQNLTRRGLGAAKADWAMLCLAHNVKKLWRAKKAASRRSFVQEAPLKGFRNLPDVAERAAGWSWMTRPPAPRDASS